MNKSSVSLVVVALIWAAVIAALSMVLKGSPRSGDATVLVTGGAVATLILFGAAHRRSMRA
jgi:hypothetical protein